MEKIKALFSLTFHTHRSTDIDGQSFRHIKKRFPFAFGALAGFHVHALVEKFPQLTEKLISFIF